MNRQQACAIPVERFWTRHPDRRKQKSYARKLSYTGLLVPSF